MISMTAIAQTWNINMATDSISITGDYNDNRFIVFSNKYTQYDSRYLKYGLHFRNNRINEVNNPIAIANLIGSPTIGAWGVGTEVVIKNSFLSDGGQSVPHLVVGNGGKIRFSASSVVDLVLPGSFFTRQFWCLGDGTGIVELDPGFVADRTNGGLADLGFGSIRLNNVIFVTHESQGLPLGYRPNPSLINSHFVFERNPGSVWQIRTNDQEYKGGLWIEQNMKIDAVKNVNVSGVKAIWPDYVNFGGVFIRNPNITLTKVGQGTFTLSGEHGYALDSRFLVQEGAVEFQTDPFNEADSIFYKSNNRVHGQNLVVELEGDGRVVAKASTVRLRTLQANSSSVETVVWNGSKIVAKTANLNGTFSFRLRDGLLISQGDSFVVTNFSARNGVFSAINLPTYNNALVWDTSRFYSNGVLKVISGTVVTSTILNQNGQADISISPNPFQNEIKFFGSGVRDFTLMDIQGRIVFDKKNIGNSNLIFPSLPSGLYLYKLNQENGKSIFGRLKRE